VTDIIEEMKEYYCERANEYDDWYNRKNNYDKGEELNTLWFENLEILKSYCLNIKEHSILELAAGTGKWTQYLKESNRITIVDFSDEMLKINVSRTGVSCLKKDIFDLVVDEPENYDMCFFGFWLSHVPEERLDDFFFSVRKSVSRGARVVIFDSYLNKNELNCLKFENNIQVRPLLDGKIFNVYKKYYTQSELEEKIGKYFSEFKIELTPHYFFIFDGILK